MDHGCSRAFPTHALNLISQQSSVNPGNGNYAGRVLVGSAEHLLPQLIVAIVGGEDWKMSQSVDYGWLEIRAVATLSCCTRSHARYTPGGGSMAHVR